METDLEPRRARIALVRRAVAGGAFRHIVEDGTKVSDRPGVP